MSTQNKSSSSGGVGFGGLLTILFIGLKLTGVIDWSWWWVLSPIWIVAGLVLLAISLAAFGQWCSKPRTPEEKAAAACRAMAEELRKRH
jgi:hypothetical protein